MPPFVGRALPRFEDKRFVTGSGRYTADLNLPGQAHTVLVRSPHAHAELRAIDGSKALAAPGVLAVYTADDLLEAGIGPIPSFARTPPFEVRNANGTRMVEADQYPLATDRVRYVGQPVAIVVAETREQALDAAELVLVDYEPLQAVPDLKQAMAEGAPRLWPDAPGNVSGSWETGNGAGVGEALRNAAHVVDVTVDYPRISVSFMEPRAALATYDDEADRVTLHVGCQGANRLRDMLAAMLGVEKRAVRVIVPDVGGGFGARGNVYPEFIAAVHATRMLGRPVKWVAERSESFLTDTQARSQTIDATLGMDDEGRILGVRVSSTWRHGAYLSPRSIFVLAHWMGPLTGGPYRVPVIHFSCRGVFTNTAPVAAYRGVARAEAIYVMERLLDAVALKSGMDRVALRRRNLIPATDLPYTNPAGLTFGVGDFHRNLEMALAAIDRTGVPARRNDAARDGRLLGWSVAPFIMGAGSVPEEFGAIRIDGSGAVSARVGTQDFGMGHETTFAQVISDRLGVPPEAVSLIQGDTDVIPAGAGAQGSRCMRIGGGAVAAAADSLIDKACRHAEELLETDRSDIVFEAPDFVVRGTDRRIGLADVAAHAEASGQPLSAEETFVVDGPSYPNGCHACEVTIDPETGRLTIERFVTVFDPGVLVNPLIVDGQMHGGVAQSIGEATREQVFYMPDTGQLATGSLMDYALPRAADLPDLETLANPYPEADNPLGVKGVGEAGSVGAQAAIVNAVLDALADHHVRQIDMPLTPERIWRALNREV